MDQRNLIFMTKNVLISKLHLIKVQEITLWHVFLFDTKYGSACPGSLAEELNVQADVQDYQVGRMWGSH
jgi:hypothetical protein